MKTVTVNIAFSDKLLKDIARVTRRESRNRSGFLREAARACIQRRKRWDNIFAMGRKAAKKQTLKPEDSGREIQAYRKGKT